MFRGRATNTSSTVIGEPMAGGFIGHGPMSAWEPGRLMVQIIAKGATLRRGAFPVLLMALSAARPAAPPSDGVATVELRGAEDIGTYGGVAFRRYHGILHGAVAGSEAVAGLSAVLGGRPSLPYDVAFELIAPVRPQPASTVIVEVENRGRPALLASLAGFQAPDKSAPNDIIYPAGLGNGFPFREGVAYGRVAWQAGIAPVVPQNAQGVGEVILRQFGQLLAKGGVQHSGDPLPSFAHRVLAGTSQSAWMVNAFIWEGFNRDPASGGSVYQAAFTRDGVGNVLAINRAAQGGAQVPYMRPDAVPLTPAELLQRPKTDPILVDIAAYTDFYRLRASLFQQAPGVPGLYRYAVAAAHAPAGVAPNALIFGMLRCNESRAIPLNPLNDAAQDRALLTALIGQAGAEGITPTTLPPERQFVLIVSGGAVINPLSGQTLRVPFTDAEAMPVGGVPMTEAALPLGRPVPPSIPPIGTRSINDVCGNFGGWEAFTPEQLKHRYGSLQNYIRRAVAMRGQQLKAGFLLPVDVVTEGARIERMARAAFGATADPKDSASDQRHVE